ncbi:MAG: thiamine pyrophosphate-dependent dehydrogenase E1 component subunit alpha [Magnetococcales bacterium]|nr:thiamine pyrophosphate-dependent dehydrogenase E1 component subunit alpha [Magnetococcales bacterium]
MSEQELPRLYEQMVLIRGFERMLEDLFRRNLLFGTTHSCAGQEAAAVGLMAALAPGDLVTGHHRSHGHYLARTDDVTGLLAEIMGRQGGVVGGRGGSQHLCGGGFISNGIQGSMVPVATGMALAEKIAGSGRIVVCCIGDGTLGQGVVYESLNIAALWSLPLLIVVENNQYAMSSPVARTVAGSMTARAQAFGVEAAEITSNDVVQLLTQARDVVAQVRQACRPFFWVIHTYRQAGHSKSDDCCYRTRAEETRWGLQDPLLLAGSQLDPPLKETIDQRCARRLQESLAAAQGMPMAEAL